MRLMFAVHTDRVSHSSNALSGSPLTLSPPLPAFLSAISGLCMFVTFACAILVFVFRKHRVIFSASTLFCSIVIAASFLVQIAAILTVADKSAAKW